MTSIDDLAHRGSSWWAEERIQRRRIELLKPYSLRVHLDENQQTQLLFFNGRYARYYQEIMDAMAMRSTEDTEGWSRAETCSHCKGNVTGMTVQRTRARSEEP
ncbi:MAG TPA: hypothetical protein VMG10_06520 [Gemmataceae bacterium]|nr:hypothetical protein [Gemmataceae bacterium]